MTFPIWTWNHTTLGNTFAEQYVQVGVTEGDISSKARILGVIFDQTLSM